MDKPIKLPPRLDASAAEVLASELTERLGRPVEIDGDEVSFAGALGLQVLVAARRQWARDGVAYLVQCGRGRLVEGCRGLGITPSEVGLADEAIDKAVQTHGEVAETPT